MNVFGIIARACGYELIRRSRLPYRDIYAHLMALFRQLDINHVLDVGANVGQYATGLRQAGYHGRILSFEPIPKCYEELIRRADGDWHVYNYALGSADEVRSINIAHKNVFSSFLGTNQYGTERFRDAAAVTHSQQVTVKMLDSVFREIVPATDPRVFLKLDTQGYDLEVLKGARQTLPHVLGLQTELASRAIYQGMPTHLESLAYIDTLGYQLTDIYPLSHDKHDMSLLEFDCVFRKKLGG